MASECEGLSPKEYPQPSFSAIAFWSFAGTCKKVIDVEDSFPPLGKTRPFIGTRQFIGLIHEIPKAYRRDGGSSDRLTQLDTGVWAAMTHL